MKLGKYQCLTLDLKCCSTAIISFSVRGRCSLIQPTNGYDIAGDKIMGHLRFASSSVWAKFVIPFSQLSDK